MRNKIQIDLVNEERKKNNKQGINALHLPVLQQVLTPNAHLHAALSLPAW